MSIGSVRVVNEHLTDMYNVIISILTLYNRGCVPYLRPRYIFIIKMSNYEKSFLKDNFAWT